MSATEALMRSWNLDVIYITVLLIAALLYLRGWLGLHRQRPERFGPVNLISFLLGELIIFIALCSPLEAASSMLLQAHMGQHILLMLIAPPLLWIGAPGLPLLWGLPPFVRKAGIGPFLASPGVRRIFRVLTHPIFTFFFLAAVLWTWHLPWLYQLSLTSPAWHQFEHACFFWAGMLFWYPVILPYPAQVRWSRWLVVPYLLLAALQNTIFSAIFCFSSVIFYPYYEQVPNAWAVKPLDDQAVAGGLMWIIGSLVMLAPVLIIVRGLVRPKGLTIRQPQAVPLKRLGLGQSHQLPVLQPSAQIGTLGGSMTDTSAIGSPTLRRKRRGPFDLLAVPVVGSALSSLVFRRCVQATFFALALLIMLDGWLGPQVASMNLAGALPWIHWRGFLVIALLIVGNLFCFGCPFVFVRTLGRKLLPARFNWPRVLRSKWLAVGLILLFLWAYEALSLWASPWWTAWIVLGYFIAALAIDGLFRGAAFCKYVCPIGQFQFVQSVVSPTEVRVRELDRCTSCTTYDCIKGTAQKNNQGCELHLFQPRKKSNLDCTFCMDCVRACPHDNIGILATTPGSTLLQDDYRSSIRRLSRRLDLALLALVLVFGAFANAAGMVGPVLEWQDQTAAAWGMSSRMAVVTVGVLASCLVIPVVLVGLATALSQITSINTTPMRLAVRMIFGLIPMGMAMWTCHFIFHFLTSMGTVVPITQRMARDVGLNLGEPAWILSCCQVPPDWLLPLEIFILAVGAVASSYLLYRLALRMTRSTRDAVLASLPWLLITALLYLVGIWTMLQPMEMRGTLDVPLL